MSESIIKVAFVMFVAGCAADGGSGGGGSGGSGGSGGAPSAAGFGVAAGQWEGGFTGSRYTTGHLDVGTGTLPNLIIASAAMVESDDFSSCRGTRYAAIELNSGGSTGHGATFVETDCTFDGDRYAMSALESNFTLLRVADAETGYGVLGGTWEAISDDGARCRLVAREGTFRAECDAEAWVGTFNDGMFTASTSAGLELAARRIGNPVAGPRANQSAYGALVGGWTMTFSGGIGDAQSPRLTLGIDAGRLVAEARWRDERWGCGEMVAIDLGVDVTVDGGQVSGSMWAEGPTDCDSDRLVRLSLPISGARQQPGESAFGAVGGAWSLSVDGTACTVAVAGDGFTSDCDNGARYEGHGSDGLFTVNQSNGFFELAAFRSRD